MASKYMSFIFRTKVDEAGLKRLQKKIETLSSKMNRFGKKTQQVGQNLARNLGLPIAAIGGAALKFGGDFEAAMNQVQAKTMASRGEMELMSKEARRLGATTQYTAVQAAGAMIEFSKAGLTTNQILKATGSALSFAAASGLEMGEVAKITANTMAQFNLEADQAARISDVIAMGANSATTDVTEMGEALSYAGSVAGAAGVPLEDTVALISALANKGVVASRAGTSIANSIARLQNVTSGGAKALARMGLSTDHFADKSGKMKMTVREAFGVLVERGITAAETYEIFGERAARSLVGLFQDLKAVDDMQAKVNNSAGFAAKQGAIAMKGFQGAIKEMFSAAQEAFLALGDAGLLRWATSLIKKLTDVFRWFGNLSKPTLKFISVLGLTILSAIGLTFAIGGLAVAFGFLGKMMAGAAIAGSPFIVGLMALLLPVLKIIAVFSILYLIIEDILAAINGDVSLTGWIIEGIAENWKKFKEWVSNAKEQMFELGRFIKGLFGFGDEELNAKVRKQISSENTASNVQKMAAAHSGRSFGGGYAVNNIRRSASQTIRNQNANQNVNQTNEININVSGSEATPEAIGEKAVEAISRGTRSARFGLRPVYAQ